MEEYKKELTIQELKLDLKKLGLHSFGNSSKSKINFKNFKAHLSRNKYRYAIGLGHIVGATIIKNKLNKRLNKNSELKKEKREEEMFRRIIKEELNKHKS